MRDQAPEQLEVEWQFDALDLNAAVRWLGERPMWQSPLVVAGETREITDTYFDIDDWRVEVEVEPEALPRLGPFIELLCKECLLSPAVSSKFEAGLLSTGITPPEPPE